MKSFTSITKLKLRSTQALTVYREYILKNAIVLLFGLVLCFKIGSHEAQTGFELQILLPWLPQCWDYKQPPCSSVLKEMHVNNVLL